MDGTPPPRHWRPSPLIRASFALHVAAAATIGVRPGVWPWAVGAVVADHLLLTAAGLWPRSALLGPNWTRLPDESAAVGAIAITLDDGPDPVITPHVLTQLDDYRAKATFFFIGERVERYPELAREVIRRGHAIENHSQRHLNRFSVLGPRGIEREISRAQEAIETITGERPGFFRAPAGLRSPLLEPVLARLGLRLASWTRRGFDTVKTDAASVLRKLTNNLQGGDILLLHDGHAAHTSSGSPVVLEVLPRLLQAAHRAGLTPVTLRSALT